MSITHAELIKHAEKWLLKSKGCAFAFTELVTYASETPDAIGWKGTNSMLVECKATRSDFTSDKIKRFRQDPAIGIGAFRFYMCPHDLIQPHEVPDKWGLIWVWKNGNKKQLKGPKGNIYSSQENQRYYFSERNEIAETIMLVSALRRLHLRGDLEKIYISPFSPDTRFCYNTECTYFSRPHWCIFKNYTELTMCPSRKERI